MRQFTTVQAVDDTLVAIHGKNAAVSFDEDTVKMHKTIIPMPFCKVKYQNLHKEEKEGKGCCLALLVYITSLWCNSDSLKHRCNVGQIRAGNPTTWIHPCLSLFAVKTPKRSCGHGEHGRLFQ